MAGGEWLWVDVLKQAMERRAAWHGPVREGRKGIVVPISAVLQLRVQQLSLLPTPQVPRILLVPEVPSLTSAYASSTLAGASGGVEQHAVSGQRQRDPVPAHAERELHQSHGGR